MSDDNVIKLGGKSRGKLRGKSDGNNKNSAVVSVEDLMRKF